jgi:hypothetical protein
MAGVVYIPWYATLFRQDRLAEALKEVAPVAFRYGATQYRIHRSRDDQYRFTHMVWFASKEDWERFWEGPELTAFRARVAGWYQVPLLYVWHDEIGADVIEEIAADSAPVSESPTLA